MPTIRRKAKTGLKVKGKKVTHVTLTSLLEETPQRRIVERRTALERVSMLLSTPSMSPEAIRERIAQAAAWESEHGVVSVFAGSRR